MSLGGSGANWPLDAWYATVAAEFIGDEEKSGLATRPAKLYSTTPALLRLNRSQAGPAYRSKLNFWQWWLCIRRRLVCHLVVDDAGGDDVGGDVDGGAGHVEDAVGAEDEGDSFGGDVEVDEQSDDEGE